MTDVPWDDAQSLLIWVEHHLREVPPLVLERLLAHFGFEEAGEMPTRNPVRCVVWKHKRRAEDVELAKAAFLVYHFDTVARDRVLAALQLIERVRRRIREIDRK
jgi:hypothetical protein